MVKVLFVCMGNICRSPTAEVVFNHLVNESGVAEHIQIDSAGTHGYHIGDEPDRRTQKAAEKRGLPMSHLRARQVDLDDFEMFDYIVAMDQDNYDHLVALSPKNHKDKVSLLLVHSETIDDREVPDPYYGGLNGFEHVLDLVHEGSRALLEKILEDHELK